MTQPLGSATANVTTTSSIIVPAPSSRTSLVITNLGDVVIYLAEGETAVVGEGIPLQPNQAYITGQDSTSVGFTGSIHAIHGDIGNKAVAIMER